MALFCIINGIYIRTIHYFDNNDDKFVCVCVLGLMRVQFLVVMMRKVATVWLLGKHFRVRQWWVFGMGYWQREEYYFFSFSFSNVQATHRLLLLFTRIFSVHENCWFDSVFCRKVVCTVQRYLDCAVLRERFSTIIAKPIDDSICIMCYGVLGESQWVVCITNVYYYTSVIFYKYMCSILTGFEFLNNILPKNFFYT